MARNFDLKPRIKRGISKTGGKKAVKPRKKRIVLTLEEKVQAIRELHARTPADKVANLMGVGKTQIYTIKKRKAEIMRDYENNMLSSSKCRKGHIKKEWLGMEEKIRLDSQKLLDDFCRKFGRKSSLVKKRCKSICNMIKQYSEYIVHVFAAYRKENESEIIFVVTVIWDFELTENDIAYRFVKRNYGDLSTEGFDISNSKQEKDHAIRADGIGKLNACISKYSVELLVKHKYLSIISGSSVRSKDYKPSSPCLIRESCLALYVYVKGYIPIEEDAFETTYGGVAVDIREGLFFPYGTATERHDDIKMGCKIMRPTHSSRVIGGTLGGFIEHPTYGLCGITCAHAMMYPDELKHFRNGEISWPNIRLDDSVCQPKHPDKIGRIVQAIYQEGGESEIGVEISLIQIEDRPPVSGEFPLIEQNGRRSLLQSSFETGKTSGISRYIEKELYKFGCMTDFTSGRIVKSTPMISVRKLNHIWSDNGYDITLYNQIEVKTECPGNFATHGDSGSLVFCQGVSGDLECIGMVEGGTSYNTCVVTPIQPILEALKVSSLKEFQSVKSKKQISAIGERLKVMENTVNNMSSMMQRNATDNRLNAMEEKVDTILSILQSFIPNKNPTEPINLNN